MSTQTVRVKEREIYKDWHVIDAADRPLGRVASEAARILLGKHKPAWEPHLDCGDFVIVINAEKVRLTGRKEYQIRFYRHSGYPGGLKSRTWEEQMNLAPHKILERTIKGMLPGGSLGKQVARHLKVYAGPDHPHQAQVIGSERAREAREQAQREALEARYQKKPRRLAPLPVPDEEKQTQSEATSFTPPAERSTPPAEEESRPAASQAAAEEETTTPPVAEQPAEEPTTENAEVTGDTEDAGEDKA